jgi:tRNA(His) guanylyltransferase
LHREIVSYRKDFFGADRPLQSVPSFDARTVLYPNDQTLRDYLSWRQVDCHINNLYNTVFWTLVQKGGMTNQQAQDRLKGTFSNDKNEILFSQFGINYNNEPEQFKKGTTLWRKRVELPIEDAGNEPEPQPKNPKKSKQSVEGFKIRTQIQESNCDIIGDQFWIDNPEVLNPKLKV